MRLVCISDTHNLSLSELDLPEGDLLIHAGDATMRGSNDEVTLFNKELGLVKDRYTHGIVFTPGNHDFYFEHISAFRRAKHEHRITNATLVMHETVEVAGLKIFMSPYTPEFHDWQV